MSEPAHRVASRNKPQSLEPIAYHTYSYESTDQYLRTMEPSPNLWLNLNIEFETERVARSRVATETFE